MGMETVQDLETDKDEDGGCGGEDVHASSAGQADGGGDPETGGGSETADHVLALMEDDGACTDETDTRDDLGGHAGDVPSVFGGGHGTFETVGRDNHKQGRTEGHEEVGAQSGFLRTVFTFPTNGTA